MQAKFNRKQWKDGIKKRQQASHDTKEDSGMYKSIFKDEIPKSKFWKPTEGEHQVNIIPYLAGKHDPKIAEGEPTYLLDVWVFTNVGANEGNYVALARNYDLPDPRAEYQSELKQDPEYDEELVKSLYPKRRVVYNVEVLDSPQEQAKGIQLFEVPHFSFEKPLLERSKLPKGGGFVYFADADEGKTVSFEIKKGTYTNKTTGKTGKKMDYISFQFIDRKPLSDELLKSAYQLDEIIHIPEYDELKAASFGTGVVTEQTEQEQPEQTSESDVQDPEPIEEQQQEFPADICPLDQNYGEDFDKFQECDVCEVRIACQAKQAELHPPVTKKLTPKPKEATAPTAAPIRRRPGR